MRFLHSTALALALAAAGPALAQSQQDHGAHHPPGQATPAPAPQGPQAAPAAPGTGPMPMLGQMMQQIPEQCRAAMQAMPQACMGMMQQMMRGGMMQGGMGHGMQGAAPQGQPASPAVAAFRAANARMHQAMDIPYSGNVDVDFVRGMIPHHRGAIDMARVLIEHGRDEQTRRWAQEIIREQEREIREMEEWLRRNGG